MMYETIVISLIEIAIHVCTMDGMIFGRLASRIDALLDRYGLGVLSMPIHSCVICMGGIWTIILYPIIFGWHISLIFTVPMVIGLNSILSYFIKHLEQ